MCVLYVSCGSNVWVRCHALYSVIYFKLQIALTFHRVLPGLLCFVQAKTVCRYCCMHSLAALVHVCVDVILMSSA